MHEEQKGGGVRVGKKLCKKPDPTEVAAPVDMYRCCLPTTSRSRAVEEKVAAAVLRMNYIVAFRPLVWPALNRLWDCRTTRSPLPLDAVV